MDHEVRLLRCHLYYNLLLFNFLTLINIFSISTSFCIVLDFVMDLVDIRRHRNIANNVSMTDRPTDTPSYRDA